jgi:hypothetical protein
MRFMIFLIPFICSSLNINHYDIEVSYKLFHPITHMNIANITERTINYDKISYNNLLLYKKIHKTKVLNLEKNSKISSFILEKNNLQINTIDNNKKLFIKNNINQFSSFNVDIKMI